MLTKVFISKSHTIKEADPGNRLLAAVQMLTTGKSEFHRPHYAELQYFVNCLIMGIPPSPSGEDTLKDLEAISRGAGYPGNLTHIAFALTAGKLF